MTAQTIIQWLWQWSWQASVVITLVLLVRWTIFRGPLVRWRSTLWFIVLARLLLPVHPQSNFSVFNAGEWIGHLNWHTQPVEISSAVPAVVAHSTDRVIVRYGPVPLTAEPAQIAKPPTVKQTGIVFGLLIAWIIGVALMLLRTAYSQLIFARWLRHINPTNDPKLIDALHDAAAWMHIAHPPLLLVTDIPASPAISGLVRPRLLLPPSSADRLTPSQLRHVFLHELAHVKRGDLWIDLLCTILLAAQWFNPLAWLAFALYRSDREIARDAMALGAAPKDLAESYGHTIVALIERIAGNVPLPAGALGVLERRRGLRQRVIAIAHHQSGRIGWLRITFVSTIVLFVGASVLTSCKKPDQQAPSNTTQRAAIVANEAALSSAADDTAKAILRRQLPKITIDAGDLPQAIKQLSQIAGQTIVIEQPALAATAAEKNRRQAMIHFQLQNDTVENALWRILRAADPAGQRLDFAVVHGTITVSTESALKRATAQTQVYDISDLLVEVPDFQNAPTLAGMSTTQPSQVGESSKPMTLPEKIQAIIKFVQETVDPNSWKEYATIREQAKQLVVYQTPANQDVIATLFNRLRASRGIEVTVEARFIQVDTERMKVPENTWLDDDQVTALLKGVESTAESSELSAPRLTLFNGQRAWVGFMHETPYVSDLTAVRGKDGNVSYQPVVSKVTLGTVFDVQATVSADRKYVTLTVRPQLSSLLELHSEKWKGSLPGEKDLFVQVPIVAASSLETTCSIPNGGTLLLGGLDAVPRSLATGNAATLPSHPTSAPNPKLKTFILVRPNIILTREPAKRSKPSTSPRNDSTTDQKTTR
jgi:beta-lactamase regulating signal transducer with metallopeptidase domain